VGRLSPLKSVLNGLKGMKKQTSKMSASIVYREAHLPESVKMFRGGNPSIKRKMTPIDTPNPIGEIASEATYPFVSEPATDILDIVTKSLGSIKKRQKELNATLFNHKHLMPRE